MQGDLLGILFRRVAELVRG